MSVELKLKKILPGGSDIVIEILKDGNNIDTKQFCSTMNFDVISDKEDVGVSCVTYDPENPYYLILTIRDNINLVPIRAIGDIKLRLSGNCEYKSNELEIKL